MPEETRADQPVTEGEQDTPVADKPETAKADADAVASDEAKPARFAPEEGTVGHRVVAIVAEQMNVKPEAVTPETSFINDLGADSLDTVELVMEFEDAFDMTIPDEEAEKILTVGDAIKYVKEHQ